MNKQTIIILAIVAVLVLAAIYAFSSKTPSTTTTISDKSVGHGGAGSTLGSILGDFNPFGGGNSAPADSLSHEGTH